MLAVERLKTNITVQGCQQNTQNMEIVCQHQCCLPVPGQLTQNLQHGRKLSFLRDEISTSSVSLFPGHNSVLLVAMQKREVASLPYYLKLCREGVDLSVFGQDEYVAFRVFLASTDTYMKTIFMKSSLEQSVSTD